MAYRGFSNQRGTDGTFRLHGQICTPYDGGTGFLVWLKMYIGARYIVVCSLYILLPSSIK